MDAAAQSPDATTTQVPRTVHSSSVMRRNARVSRSSVSMSPRSPATHPMESLQNIQPGSSSSPKNAKLEPLADITLSAINGQQSHVLLADQKETEPPSVLPVPDKPMEMAIRARAKGVAQPIESEHPTSRTVIKFLVLQNFKSYAGRQEVGPFHASFSSVVGPNGSGKSNVIDSLLFVFGFRASKMRQGKISSLIHNSAAFPDLEYCEVEVHFEEVRDLPDGRKELIPDSTLVVSRKAFRNNSSRYYIDGKESNFTAVTTLLKDRGVDLDHKRFLILQGEVESIAQMKPKALNEHDDGLLEYLEDIIGTSKYKKPIEESAAEIETLNEVCTEKNTRVQHVEKEKKNLETKRNAAIAYVQDENDLALKQSSLCQIFMHECDDNIQISQEAVQQMQSQLDHELEKHRGSQDSIKALEQQYESHVKQYESAEASTKAIVQQLAKADKETVKIEEKRKHLNAKVKKLEKTIAVSDKGFLEASAYLQRLSDDIDRNTKEVLEVENNLELEDAELSRIRESLRGKTEGLSNEISVKQQQLEPWTAQIGEKKSAIALVQSELSILLERQEAGSQALSKIEDRLSEIEKDRLEKVEQIASGEAHRKERQLETQDLQVKLNQLAKSEPQVRARLSSARQQTDEARASLAKSQVQGSVLAGLSRLSESGRIAGFHGRLGNLGTIDQTYDVAISTACPALDNLVVDTVDGGQQCIEYLRKNNLGRANFILLERLAQRDLTAIDTPEGVPRLFDLVKTKDDKFRPAFYSVLQNTLVAQDLSQANRIAYGTKRWRVVTLDGQLIDKSGTMSGGGHRITKGAMSAKLAKAVSKDQVAKLEAQQEVEEQQAKSLQEEIEKLTEFLHHASDDLPKLDTRLQRLQLDLDSTDRDLDDSRRRRSELVASEKTAKIDQSRVATLERATRVIEKELVDLHENANGIECDIKILQDKIMEFGGVKLRMQKARVDGLREQLSTLTDELSSAESYLGKTQKQQEKHSKAKGEAEVNLAAVLEDVGKLDQELDAHLQSQAKARQQAAKAEEELELTGERMHALKVEVEQKTADVNEARYVELEMRNKLDENQKALAENLKRRTYWEDKLRKLTINPIAELEEIEDGQTLTTHTPDELADLDKTVLKGEIAVLEEKLQNTDVDLSVIDEYRRRVEEHAERSSDLAQAIEARDAAKRRSEELRRLRLEGFMNGFSTISMRLKEMYQMITMGGNAELELVDSLDPFSEGILFSVMPPKKSWKNISNLSGGEKTLSSLALVFALHHYKPTPLYVMDEIDAALDFRNVSIVASYIKERTRNAQFIVISLRNNMFELASRLVGVYKVNHMTKSVTVENRDYISRN